MKHEKFSIDLEIKTKINLNNNHNYKLIKNIISITNIYLAIMI